MARSTENYATSNSYLMPDPDCYIYLHHVINKSGKYGVLILLPSYASEVNDSIQVTFSSETPLSRSAPIYSYQNSGPRSLQVHFDLHRDEMYQLNWNLSNASTDLDQLTFEGLNYSNQDYVDIMAREIQAAALPSYNIAQKMVNPPLVSMKLGNDIFITGVVTGSVGVSYGLPILESKKYAQVKIDFSISEVIPYSADDVARLGSFRGVDLSEIFNRSGYKFGSDANNGANSILSNLKGPIYYT